MRLPESTPTLTLTLLLGALLAFGACPSSIESAPLSNHHPFIDSSAFASELDPVSIPETPPAPYSDEWFEPLEAALIEVESGGDPRAFNVGENAIGVLQVRPIMVRDVNRISGSNFEHEAAWDEAVARSMFRTFVRHYCKTGTYEEAARAWNGGPKGPTRSSTLPYWGKVWAVLEANRHARVDSGVIQTGSRGSHD